MNSHERKEMDETDKKDIRIKVFNVKFFKSMLIAIYDSPKTKEEEKESINKLWRASTFDIDAIRNIQEVYEERIGLIPSDFKI